MINYWNARFGFSFNEPFWSVSIELFIYIAFFLFSSVNALSSGKKMMWLVTLFFFFFYAGILIPFSEGLLFFFSGCYLINSSKNVNKKNILIAMGLLMLVILIKYTSGNSNTSDINRVAGIYIQLYIAASMVIAFMLTGRKAGDRVQKTFRHVGNMTYAIYMTHISPDKILYVFNVK